MSSKKVLIVGGCLVVVIGAAAYLGNKSAPAGMDAAGTIVEANRAHADSSTPAATPDQTATPAPATPASDSAAADAAKGSANVDAAAAADAADAAGGNGARASARSVGARSVGARAVGAHSDAHDSARSN